MSLSDFLSRHYSEVVKNIVASLKTAIRSEFLLKTNKFNSFVEELKTIFWACDLDDPSQEALNLFSGLFMLNFSQELLLLLVRAILGSPPAGVPVLRKKWSSDDVDSEEFKEIIYYIGGSVLHSFHSALRRFPKAEDLNRFCGILKDRFQEMKDLTSQESDNELDRPETCEEAIKDWTKARDRGGVIYKVVQLAMSTRRGVVRDVMGIIFIWDT